MIPRPHGPFARRLKEWRSHYAVINNTIHVRLPVMSSDEARQVLNKISAQALQRMLRMQ